MSDGSGYVKTCCYMESVVRIRDVAFVCLLDRGVVSR